MNAGTRSMAFVMGAWADGIGDELHGHAQLLAATAYRPDFIPRLLGCRFRADQVCVRHINHTLLVIWLNDRNGTGQRQPGIMLQLRTRIAITRQQRSHTGFAVTDCDEHAIPPRLPARGPRHRFDPCRADELAVRSGLRLAVNPVRCRGPISGNGGAMRGKSRLKELELVLRGSTISGCSTHRGNGRGLLCRRVHDGQHNQAHC